MLQRKVENKKTFNTTDSDCTRVRGRQGSHADYALVDELEKIDKQGVKVIVPSQKQAQKIKQENRFDKSEFAYDSDKDCCICPVGHVLQYSYTNTLKRAKVYRGGVACKSCICFGECTKQDKGRSISLLLKAELKDKKENASTSSA